MIYNILLSNYTENSRKDILYVPDTGVPVLPKKVSLHSLESASVLVLYRSSQYWNVKMV